MTTTQKPQPLSDGNRSPKSPDFGNFGKPTTGVVGLLQRKAVKLLAGILLLAVLIGAGYFAYSRFIVQSRTTATNEAALQTAKATIGNLVLQANGTGTVMPAAESNFGFNTSGQVSDIDVKIGDRVESGQVLAQLDDSKAKVQLAEAQGAMNKLTSAAAIATAKQTLAEAKTTLATTKASLEYLISPEVLYWEENVTVRQQNLKDAQTAAQTDSSAAAKQKVTDAETSLKFAQDSLAHFQTVYQYEYVPQTFTQTKTKRTRTGYHTIIVKLRDETTGERYVLIYPPTEGEIGMARADYEAAKAAIAEDQTYLDVMNGAEIPQEATGANLVAYIKAKDALKTAEYNLNATKLIAPISGTVSALDMTVGDLVNGTQVITISNLDQPYSIDAYLDAKDWGEVQAGYEVEVEFDILPDQVFKGTVTKVYPTLDTSSSNSALIHFTALLSKNIPYELPGGSSASVDVIGGRAENAVLVPVEALHQLGEGKYALFVMKNGKLRLRVVQVGLQDLTKAQILSGLNAGDVVTTGVVKTK